MIRQNPNNPCIIESSLDGTNWCPFIDLSLCQNFGGQPGPTDPPAPGGTQQTCAKLEANRQLLIPTLVSTGDTIRLDNANGAGWDGGEFIVGPTWRLPSGNIFLGGIDAGDPHTDAGDPVPSANHMSIIAVIGGSPVYLALPEGTPVTVPAGVTAGQLWLQVNDDAIGNNQGSYDICVTVTNNQTFSWYHTYDLTVSLGSLYSDKACDPFVDGPSAGEFLVGQGYKTTLLDCDPTNSTDAWLILNMPAGAHLTYAFMEFSITPGVYTQSDALYSVAIRSTNGVLNGVLSPTIPSSPFEWSGDEAASKIAFEINAGGADSGDPGGEGFITTITIAGYGPAPTF